MTRKIYKPIRCSQLQLVLSVTRNLLCKLRNLSNPTRRLLRFFLLAFTTFLFIIQFTGINLWSSAPALATPNLTIEPITWNFIGLDSNNVNVGPNTYVTGARVCNVGSSPAVNLTVKFVKDGVNNPFINLQGNATLSLPLLPSGNTPPKSYTIDYTPSNCADFYYNLVVTRTAAAYDTTQQFHIEAKADNAGLVSTPTPRELYVEKLLSQARNEVLSFTGPSTVYVGDVVQYTVTGKTATAYPQLTFSADFPNIVFQILGVKTYYSNPGAVNSTVYADACGWVSDPSDIRYHRSATVCDNPDNYTNGGAGGNVTTTYTIKVLATGNGASSSSATISNLILDFSGGSYHYNADLGTGIGTRTIQIIDPPPADLSLDKSHTGNFGIGTNKYTLTVTNNGTGAAKGPITVTDTLPTGFTFVSGTGTGWTCSASGQIVTCTNPNSSVNGMVTGATSTITLEVSVGSTAATNSLNTATVSNATPDSNLANNTDTDPTTVLQGANLSLTKEDTPDTFVIGKTGTYNLTVTNGGNLVAAAPITIADTLPTGISYVSASGTGWSCTAEGQNVLCTNSNSLAVGSSSTVNLTVTINPNAAVNGTNPPTVTNTATVSSATFDPNTTNNTATKTTPVTPPVPDLKIEKSHVGTFATGTNNTYTLKVTNVGTESTSGPIKVSDTLPATSFTFVSATSAPDSSGWNCTTSGSPTTVTCTNPGPLVAGASSSIILTVNPSTAGSFTNTATVSTDNEANLTNNTSNDPTTVATGSIDLGVQKQLIAPIPTQPGDTVKYEVTVTNYTTGNGQDTNISFTDIVPPEITDVSWSCTPSSTGVGSGNNSCNGSNTNTVTGTGNNISLSTIALKKSNGGIEGGGKVIFSISGKVSNTFMGALVNTASVTPSAGVDAVPSNNIDSESTPINGTDLQITKTHTGNFAVNVDSLYTLTVTNVSSRSTAGVITVIDTLPSELTFVSATSAPGSSGWVCSNSGATVTCNNPGPILPGAANSSAISIVVRPTATGSFTNKATVTTVGDSVTTNNTATDLTEVVSPNIDLTISKTAPAGNFQLNQTATYTLTINNIGTTPAVGPITVTDTLPTGLTFISGSGFGWSCSATGQVVTCTRSSNLGPGSSSTISLSALVGSTTPTAPTAITNTASVAVTGDVNTSNNNTSLNKLVDPIADLQITKSHSGTFVIGQTASYTLLVTNNGPSASGAITITDTLPTGLTFVATGSGGSGFNCVTGVTCTNNTGLQPGQTATVTINASVGATTPTGTNSITNTATVTGSVTDPIPANNSSSDPTTVSTLQADLVLTKSHVGSFLLNQQGTYTLTVKNNGPAIATGTISITDPLPGNLTFVSSFGSEWTCSGTTTVNCSNPNTSGLAVGSSTAVQIRVQVGSGTPSSVTNTATVTGSITDPTPANNTASDATTIVAGTDLAISKTHGTITPGGTGSYTLTVTNNGPDTVNSQISVVDYLPIGVTYASSNSITFSCSATAGNTVTCTRNTSMISGATDTIALTVNVDASAPFPLENIADVSSPLGDSNLTNNRAIDIVNAPAGSVAEVLLVKRITAIKSGATVTSFSSTVFDPNTTSDSSDGNAKWPTSYLRGAGVLDATPSPADPVDSYNLKPGDEIEFTIYFLNAGGRSAKKVRICDALDSNLTFIPNAYNGQTPTDGGASPELGMALAIGSNTPTTYLTGVNDTPDRGQYFVTPTVPSGCNLATNTNGIVVVDITRTSGNPTFTELPAATAAGTPAESYGFLRFWARVR